MNYNKMTKAELFKIYHEKVENAPPMVKSIDYNQRNWERLPKSECIRLTKKARVNSHGDIETW